MSRRTIRTARTRKRFLEFLESTGHVLRSAAAAGACIRAFYKWREDDPAFAADWEAALERAIDRLEDEAFRRALEGVEVPVYYQGKPVGALSRFSDRLLIFLLTRLRAHKYRESPLPVEQDNPLKEIPDDRLDSEIEYHQTEEAAAGPVTREGAPAGPEED